MNHFPQIIKTSVFVQKFSSETAKSKVVVQKQALSLIEKYKIFFFSISICLSFLTPIIFFSCKNNGNSDGAIAVGDGATAENLIGKVGSSSPPIIQTKDSSSVTYKPITQTTTTTTESQIGTILQSLHPDLKAFLDKENERLDKERKLIEEHHKRLDKRENRCQAWEDSLLNFQQNLIEMENRMKIVKQINR